MIYSLQLKKVTNELILKLCSLYDHDVFSISKIEIIDDLSFTKSLYTNPSKTDLCNYYHCKVQDIYDQAGFNQIITKQGSWLYVHCFNKKKKFKIVKNEFDIEDENLYILEKQGKSITIDKKELNLFIELCLMNIFWSEIDACNDEYIHFGYDNQIILKLIKPIPKIITDYLVSQKVDINLISEE